MLEAGGSVETMNDAGVTPLMVAAMQGNVAVLRQLRNAKRESIDGSGRSFRALSRTGGGKLEAVQLLLPLVSNLETGAAAGNNLLTMALETGDMKIFQTVLERFPPTLKWSPSTLRALETALRSDIGSRSACS